MNARFVVFATLWALAVPNQADVPPEGPPLDAWIEAALKNNPARGTSQATRMTAEADALRAEATLLPTLKAQATLNRNQYQTSVEFSTPGGGPPQEIIIVPRTSTEGSVVARVPLIDPPGFLRWRAAARGAEAAGDTDRANESDVALIVARDYYAAAAAQQVLRAAQRSKSAAEENARVVRARLAEGASTPLDLDRADLEVSRAEALVIDATRAWNAARRALASGSGLPEPASLNAPPPTADPAPAESDLLAAAERARPELRSASNAVAQAENQRSAAWASFAPALYATGTEHFANAAGFTGHSTYWIAGLTAEWFLLDFGGRSADLKRERAAELRTASELRRQRIAVQDEVHSAWLDVESTRAKLVATRRGDEVSRRAVALARIRFKAGTATQLDVIQSERDALQSEVDRIRAEGDLSVARLALKRATGDLLR